jgi:homoserine dehydrogenase
MKNGIQVGLMGLGTVGSGVYKILQKNAEDIALRCGVPVTVKKVLVRNLQKERLVNVPRTMLTTDPWELINDPEISILVEVMGGMEETLALILAGFRNGKSVVSANKDLIAENGKQLFDAAEAHGCDFLFEGSVAGGIPIVRPLKQCLAANRISEVMGIVNGTTNYILSKMTAEGAPFDAVLQEAKDRGYAEADPTSDVEGYDAARKIAILASLAFNSRVTFRDVQTEGITRITDRDIAYAGELGCVIKLLAIAKEEDGLIEARVHPALIRKDHPLASVNGAYNAVFVRGDAVGEAMFHGLGAGQMPTASAVTGDIIEAVRNIRNGTRGRLLCTCYHTKGFKPGDRIISKFYLRILVKDEPGVLGNIATVLGNHQVSIASMLQKWSDGSAAEIVVLTHEVQQGSIQNALALLRDLDAVIRIEQVLRAED